VDILEGQLLGVTHRLLTLTLVLPSRHVREVLVVALGFAILLPFLAEVAAAAFAALKGIHAHQLAQFDEVGHAAGQLEGLVHFASAAGDAQVLPELLADLRNGLEGLLEAGLVAAHAAELLHDLAQLAVEVGGSPLAVDCEAAAHPVGPA